jgi:hypothetical protein
MRGAPLAVRHVVRDVTRVQPVRPAIGLGVRAAIAVALPLALTPWIGTLAAVWATLGGFGAANVDRGGAYRTRAMAIGMLAIGGSVAVAIGTLCSAHIATTIIALALGCTACALAASWGVAAVAVGNSIAVDLIVRSRCRAIRRARGCRRSRSRRARCGRCCSCRCCGRSACIDRLDGRLPRACS